MTYEEALAEKMEAEKDLAEGQVDVKLIIVPQIIDEQKLFLALYNEDSYTDDYCKIFSTNDQYTVLITIL